MGMSIKENGITVLSLFDGMSCGRIALERAGIKVNTYYSSEIDEKSIIVANYNYPEDKETRLGCVKGWKKWDIEWGDIDLILAGSPCQSISNAGDGSGLKGRSSLFYEFLEINRYVHTKNPQVRYLLENVVGKREAINTISSELTCNPIKINSDLVSAQNRPRYYWANFEIIPPEKIGVNFKDIEDSEISRYQILEGRSLNRLKSKRSRIISDKSKKSPCLLASQGKKSTDSIVIKADSEKEVYRWPTRVEMERMQTVPEGYTKPVAYNSAATMLGNGWTVDVIAHILKQSGLK